MLNEKDFTEGQQKLIDALYGGNILAVAAKGFGKASIAQTAAQELIADGVINRVLVVAPLKVCQLTWGEEWKKWKHLLEPAMAIGTAAERIKAIESGKALVIINNENVPWLVKHLKGKPWPFDGLITDEVTKWKSAGSSRVRSLRTKLKEFNWRVGLTASPLTECGIEIFAQVLLIDGGRALGRVQDVFRRTYFVPDYSGYNWEYQLGGEERLADTLKDVIYMAEDEDYGESLPELVDHHHYIELPERARVAYSEMASEMMAEVEDEEIEAPSAAVMQQKLQQIAAGGMYSGAGKNRVTHYLHSEKIKWLKNFLRPHHRVLISFWYAFEEDMLAEAFPDLDFLSDDPEGLLEKWNNHEISRLALHPQSGSHGINAQFGGHTLIMLGPVWSLDMWAQLVGRLRRRGQRSKVVDRHIIIAADTVDEQILMRLSNKQVAEFQIMNHIRQAAKKTDKENPPD